MRITKVEVFDGDLWVYDYIEPEQFDADFDGDTPIHLELAEALDTIEVAGYGKRLSKFIVELTGYTWVDKVYLDAVVKFLKENFPTADISWEETYKYLEDIKLS